MAGRGGAREGREGKGAEGRPGRPRRRGGLSGTLSFLITFTLTASTGPDFGRVLPEELPLGLEGRREAGSGCSVAVDLFGSCTSPTNCCACLWLLRQLALTRRFPASWRCFRPAGALRPALPGLS